MRRIRLALTAAVLVPIAALGLSACGDGGSKTTAGKSTCPNGKIRFGVEPYEDAAKLTPAYKALGSALEARLHCPVEVQIVQSYSAEVLAMQNGKLDLGEFGPLGYVFAARRAGAEAVVTFGNPDRSISTYKAGIWVPKNSPINDIAGLKGKKLALSEPGSTSGDALPRYAIRKAGMKDSDVQISYAGGHPQSLLALTYGKVDAAEINTQQQASAIKEGKFDPAGYKQIWASDPIANDPITVAKGLDPAVKKAITGALASLTPQDVAQVGAYLDVQPGPLIPVTQATYQPLFDLADTLGLTEKDV